MCSAATIASDESIGGGMEYGYDHFSAALLKEDASFADAGAPGTPMPAFDLPTVDGTRVRLADYLQRRRPLLLTLGSIT
jgi:hypothetical protein